MAKQVTDWDRAEPGPHGDPPMSDDQPTRDLDDPDDTQPTVELRGLRRPAPDETRRIDDDEVHGRRGGRAGDSYGEPYRESYGETQVIPDDLVPGPGGAGRAARDLNDTQPIPVGDRWSRG